MKGGGAIALLAITLELSLPARAILLEDTPERVVFLGYPGAEHELTIKLIRRKESFGLYAFRTPPGSERAITREGFVGLIEGSEKGVGLDARAKTFLVAWLARHGMRSLNHPMVLGSYYRYRFEDSGWVLQVTTRHPFVPSPAHPVPEDLVSQLYAHRDDTWRLEQLSRNFDTADFTLRDRLDLVRLGH
jgi:hypothetical protein